jgi:hypothetical protein
MLDDSSLLGLQRRERPQRTRRHTEAEERRWNRGGRRERRGCGGERVKGEEEEERGNVDWDGEHCRFCRFLILYRGVSRSTLEFKGMCRVRRCRFAAKTARSRQKWQGWQHEWQRKWQHAWPDARCLNGMRLFMRAPLMYMRTCVLINSVSSGRRRRKGLVAKASAADQGRGPLRHLQLHKSDERGMTVASRRGPSYTEST